MSNTTNYWSEVDSLLLEVVSNELLKIRSLAYQGETRKIAVVADHLHNIPTILATHDPAMLRTYLFSEVPLYKSRDIHAAHLDMQWRRLSELLQHLQ
jgi:hypothetical protein